MNNSHRITLNYGFHMAQNGRLDKPTAVAPTPEENRERRPVTARRIAPEATPEDNSRRETQKDKKSLSLPAQQCQQTLVCFI
jgi:hypothetical protein